MTTLCWKNRTVIVSLCPYEVRDEECETPVANVVLVPTYMQGVRGEHWPEFWPIFTCAEHVPALLEDLTDPENHGFERADLVLTEIKEG